MKLVTTPDENFIFWESKEREGEWINRMDFVEFLKENGLMEKHYLLDIGCGHLRHGIPLIEYLKPGHYYGYDQDESHLPIGLTGVEKYGLMWKLPTVGVEKDFDAFVFGQKFDFVMANSIFTHIHINDIKKCVIETLKYMKPKGKFFATFYMEPDFSGCDQGPGIYYCRSTQPSSFYENDFKGVCNTKVIGDWIGSKNTYGQQMVLFTKKGLGRVV